MEHCINHLTIIISCFFVFVSLAVYLTMKNGLTIDLSKHLRIELGSRKKYVLARSKKIRKNVSPLRLSKRLKGPQHNDKK